MKSSKLKEHSVFISYRENDGLELAKWIHNNLNGKHYFNKTELCTYIITTQLDKGGGSGLNWKLDFIDYELGRSNSICIVCTPSAIINRGEGIDMFHYEINWWVKNRIKRPPLLVAPKNYSVQCIPRQILESWSSQQVSVFDSNSNRIFLESLIRGITHQFRDLKTPLKEDNIKTRFDNFYFWVKDRWGRYIEVNEAYAEAAGFDSPNSMIGKTDVNMPWRSLAKFFQEGDRKLMSGNEYQRIPSFEKEIMVDRVADIMVHENVLYDNSDRVIGVQGNFIDVSNIPQFQIANHFKFEKNKLILSEELNNEVLELEEIYVFRGLVRNKPLNKIANELQMSIIEVEYLVHSLKNKLQCSRINDIVSTAVRCGLPLKLFNGK